MLPNTGKAGLGSIYKNTRNDRLVVNISPDVNESNGSWEAQHLYITSDDPIAAGDVISMKVTAEVFNGKIGKYFGYLHDAPHLIEVNIKGESFNSTGNLLSGARKVIASTDTELGLPGIPSKFIDLYVLAPCNEVEVGDEVNGCVTVKSLTDDGEYTIFAETKWGVAAVSGVTWGDIWDDFTESKEYDLCLAKNVMQVHAHWLKENYYPPTKIEK